jgi:hypothetical protein
MQTLVIYVSVLQEMVGSLSRVYRFFANQPIAVCWFNLPTGDMTHWLKCDQP